MTKKKNKGFTAKQILSCNWVEFNSRIMDEHTTLKTLKAALILEESGNNKLQTRRGTFVYRLRARISQLAKMKELDSL